MGPRVEPFRQTGVFGYKPTLGIVLQSGRLTARFALRDAEVRVPVPAVPGA
jgi:hypothetical protein